MAPGVLRATLDTATLGRCRYRHGTGNGRNLGGGVLNGDPVTSVEIRRERSGDGIDVTRSFGALELVEMGELEPAGDVLPQSDRGIPPGRIDEHRTEEGLSVRKHQCRYAEPSEGNHRVVFGAHFVAGGGIVDGL